MCEKSFLFRGVTEGIYSWRRTMRVRGTRVGGEWEGTTCRGRDKSRGGEGAEGEWGVGGGVRGRYAAGDVETDALR